MTDLPTLTLLPTYTAFPYDAAVPDSRNASDAVQILSQTPLPTLTAFPTLTSYPTPIVHNEYVTVTPYKTPTALIPSEIDREIQCAGKISFAFSYMNPKIQRTLTERFPVGSFLLMQIQLRSLDGTTIPPLQSETFRLYGSLWGRDVRFDLDRSNSDYANSRWSTPDLNTTIGPNAIYTFLVFDINPESQNFELEFSPIPKGSETAICTIKVPLPKVIR